MWLRTTTNEPSLVFTETVRGLGVLRRGAVAIDVPLLTLERATYAYHEPWQLVAVVGAADMTRAHRLLMPCDAPPLELVGQTDHAVPFVVRDIGPVKLSGRELRAAVHDVAVGADTLPTIPERQSVVVHVTPTPLAQSCAEELVHRDLGVSYDDLPLEWASSVGLLRLEQVDVVERVHVAGRALPVHVPLVRLVGEVGPEASTREPRALIGRLDEELRRFLHVVSLLSRAHVGYYGVEVQSRRYEGGAVDLVTTARWRTTHHSRPPAYFWPLVRPHALESDALNAMYHKLLGFKGRDRLAVAIPFLISSRTDGFVEERLANVFTALEAVKSGLPAPVDSDQHSMRDLLLALRSAFTQIIHDRPELPPEVVGRVERKLNSVPHLAIAEHIALLVRTHEVQWEDLWPPGTSLEVALRGAFAYRNALLHGGILPDTRRAVPETVRMHILVERLLYAALGGRPEWLDAQAYEHVNFLRSELWPEADANREGSA